MVNRMVISKTETDHKEIRVISIVINRMVEDLKDLKVISKTDKVVHSLKVSKVDNRGSLVIRMAKVVVHKDSRDKETSSKVKDKVIHKTRIKMVNKDSRTNSNKVHKEILHSLTNIR